LGLPLVQELMDESVMTLCMTNFYGEIFKENGNLEIMKPAFYFLAC